MNPIMETREFEVRVFTEKEGGEVAAWMSLSPDALFMVSSRFEYPLAPEIFIEYMKRANPEDHKFYSVFEKKNNQHIGHFEIKNISKKHGVGTGAHIILSQKSRGKGLGQELVKLLTMVGFSVLDLNRISLSVHTINYKAISTYIKSGYIIEGLIRDVLKFEEKPYSLYQMSILRHEWKG